MEFALKFLIQFMLNLKLVKLDLLDVPSTSTAVSNVSLNKDFNVCKRVCPGFARHTHRSKTPTNFGLKVHWL